MDYQLQNERTGESLALDPNRTLIGSAKHAAVRTADDGPFAAALVVRYPSGWVVHGLSDDPGVLFEGEPLPVTRRATPRPGDVLEVGEDRFRFVPAGGPPEDPPAAPVPPPSCFAYILDPDGMEECRVVDHDLLFGRLSTCHVQFPDTRLSRITALLAAHAGVWYVHALSKGRIVARNRQLVEGYEALEDGDELLVGPLAVRVEIGDPTVPERPARPEPADEALEDGIATDTPAGLDTVLPSGPEVPSDLTALHAAGRRLDNWLKGHTPAPPPQGGLGGWLGAQKARLSRFWRDTPETTAARTLRAAGRFADAFAILDRAVRTRPGSPDLLRELYRLYEAAGLTDLCYRPLRQVEKLADARGAADPWVLETLARVCERLGRTSPAMFDRALGYWTKLEAATGVSYARERAAAMATRTLRQGGFAGAEDD